MLCQALVKSDASFPAIKLGTPFSAKVPLEALPEKEGLVAANHLADVDSLEIGGC